MTKEERKQEFQNRVKNLLIQDHPDALLWLVGYATYAHAIDDIIDQDIPEDQHRQQFMLRTFEFAESIYSNIFYIQNVSRLRAIVKMASQSYMDSVLWEKDPIAWKRQVSDTLRHQCNDVLLTVIEICCGIERRQELSLEMRELSYLCHHNEEGAPV